MFHLADWELIPENVPSDGGQILSALRESEQHGFRLDAWLRESSAKRVLFERAYGDLLKGDSRLTVDVGGGLNSFSERLFRTGKYFLLDPLYHSTATEKKRLRQFSDQVSLVDWAEASLWPTGAVVIALDVFPNVDQRLEDFLRTVIAQKARALRATVTLFPSPRTYKVKRIDAEEHLVIQTPDPRAVLGTLDRCLGLRLKAEVLPLLLDPRWRWKNGRVVLWLNLLAHG